MDHSINSFVRLFSVDGDGVASVLWLGYDLDAPGLYSLQEIHFFLLHDFQISFAGPPYLVDIGKQFLQG
jgi:hypothetical protein